MKNSKNMNKLHNIEFLSWKTIEEKFDVKVKEIKKNLKRSNNCDNYWYPYKSGFNEKQCKEIIKLFRSQFLDIEIKSTNKIQYLEIFLNTIEKHQFAYTIISEFENSN